MAQPKCGKFRILLVSGKERERLKCGGRSAVGVEPEGRPRRSASALVTLYGGHLRGQALLKHSSCGLVESLTTQMTTDETVNKR